jgi:hypothetical protein
MTMEAGSPHVEPTHKHPGGHKLIAQVARICAVIFIALSIILIIIGLLPHDRIVVENREFTDGFSYGYAIEANKGDILIIDYELEGNDAAFYLTYTTSYQQGNRDYILMREHAYNNHFELDVKKSGLYWLNFESNAVTGSNPGIFSVKLSYRVMSRYSLTYVGYSIITLVIGVLMIILYSRVREKPHILLAEECQPGHIIYYERI